MKNINPNEWENYGLRKDVHNISKKLSNKNKFDIIVISKLILATISIIIDFIGIEIDDNCKIMIGIILLTLVVVTPLIVCTANYFIVPFIEILKIKKGVNKEYNNKVKKFVEEFDDEIIYYTMVSLSYYKEFEETKDSDLKKFYAFEINYNIQKSVSILLNMKNFIKYVFTSDTLNNEKIQLLRLINICDLLYSIREKMYKSGYISNISIENDINAFISQVNKDFKLDLHIKIWKF